MCFWFYYLRGRVVRSFRKYMKLYKKDIVYIFGDLKGEVWFWVIGEG